MFLLWDYIFDYFLKFKWFQAQGSQLLTAYSVHTFILTLSEPMFNAVWVVFSFSVPCRRFAYGF